MKLKTIAENHGLTQRGVDYALTQYQIVINEITHGMMSKLSYDAKDIIRMAQERWCDTCDLKEQAPVEPKVEVDTWVCGNCGTPLERQSMVGENAVLAEQFDYCPHCGRKIKWGMDRCYNAD